MNKSKLIVLLKNFTKEEMRDFGKFISSPYFSTGRNLMPMYSILKKHYPLFNSPAFSEEKIYKKLYPKKKFDTKKSLHLLSVVFSEMFALAEKFLVYNAFEKGNSLFEFNKVLAETYRSKKLFESTLKSLTKNSVLIDTMPKSSAYYSNRHLLNMELGSLYVYLNQPEKMFGCTKKNLLYIYSVIFDMMTKYVNLCFVMKRRYNFNYGGFELIKQFILSFDLDLFNKECEPDAFETKNIISINYFLLKSRLDETDKTPLISASEIYMKIFSNLALQEQYSFYELIFNRLFGRIRIGRSYLLKASKINDFVWRKGVFSPNAHMCMNLSNYNSALQIKSALLNVKELTNFVNKYSVKVENIYIKDIKTYSLAYVCFKDKDFGKCLELISRNDNLNSVGFKVCKYRLTALCFYELGLYDEFLSSVNSFELYLKNNKNVSEIVRYENQRLINCFKKLIKFKASKSISFDKTLSNAVELTRNSIFGHWFQEKLDEILCKNQN